MSEVDLERLAEECCDEFHGEGGTFQNFADDRTRWREFAKYLWSLGARPNGAHAAATEALAHEAFLAGQRRLLLDVAARDTLGEGYGAAIYKLLGEPMIDTDAMHRRAEDSRP